MKISTVAVVGAGTMGGGIAQRIATEGIRVVLVDTSAKAAAAGKQRIERLLVEGLEKEIFSGDDVDRILSRIEPTAELTAVGDADLVIEAIDEELDAKRAVFAQLGELTAPQAVLATNTCSFLVAELATATKRPERVVGLHHFYHPAKNHLVEVVGHAGSAPRSIATAWHFQERIGNTPIAARDAPGFIVYRFWVPLTNEAVRIHEEGVNIATIEEVAKGTFGIKHGPFELMNMAGIPVALNAARSLGERLGELYVPPPALAMQVHNGIDWERTGDIDYDRASEIADRLAGAVFTVALQLVSDEVGSIDDVDVGARVGLQWPLGPFELMNSFGLEQTQNLCRAAADRFGIDVPRRLTEQLQLNRPFDLSRVRLRIGNDGIARLTLNRPDHQNIMGREMIRQLATRLDEASHDPSVRAIIIGGAGKSFSAGADLKFVVDQLRAGETQPILDTIGAARELFSRIARSEKPVICHLDGAASGLGAELVLACHTLVATPSGSLEFPEAALGIIPAAGGIWRMHQRIGRGLTRLMLYGGQRFNADQLEQLGLVWRVVRTDMGEEIDTSLWEAVRVAPDLDRTAEDVSGSELLDVGAFLAAVPVGGLVDGTVTLPGGVGTMEVAREVRRRAPNALERIALLTELAEQGDRADFIAAERRALLEVLEHRNALEGLAAYLGGRRPSFVR